ncbi:AraC family transcriptional regulator [Neptuniibacter sp. QD72_48]|uniref:AraC family transcriptional regulator n=1 Tax=unclassified Neptuniibacter TaxID=2630693 RepID=UPI0039F665D1
MDTLSKLLQNLEINAEVFFSGSLCGITGFDDDKESGYLHFLESGSLTLTTDEGHIIELHTGDVIFFPSGTNHKLTIAPSEDAKLVCATVKLPPAHQKLLANYLPKFLCLHIEEAGSISNTAHQIFAEAFDEQHGKQLIIDRLCDVFMVQVLRYVIDNGTVELGLIAADSHPLLHKLMQQIKDKPEYEWTVEEMAESAAMSRSKFAALFKDTVGQAPMEYVTGLRMALAKGLLKNNRPVGLVANQVGYENASSLAKVFKKHFGVTPKQWVKSYLNPK